MSEYVPNKPDKTVIGTPEAAKARDQVMELAKAVDRKDYEHVANIVNNTPMDALKASDKEAMTEIKSSLQQGLKKNPVGDPDRADINNALHKIKVASGEINTSNTFCPATPNTNSAGKGRSH